MKTRSGNVNTSTSEGDFSTPKKSSLREEKAADLVANILKSAEKTGPKAASGQQATETSKAKAVVNGSIKKKTAVRGLPKSGRPWKEVKTKFSTIKKSAHRRTFEKKQELRNELRHIKELSNSIKEQKKLENVEKKRRREENAQKKLENERKNEIVQIIKNPAKLKRMKKKALRKIEKRDLTLGTGPKVV